MVAKQPGCGNGVGTTAQLNNPCGITMDTNGNLFITDRDNHRVCRITPQGIVSTLCGNGSSGFSDGYGSNARFNT